MTEAEQAAIRKALTQALEQQIMRPMARIVSVLESLEARVVALERQAGAAGAGTFPRVM